MTEKINSYRDLRVWQDAITLAEECYLLTRGFPREEMFSLTSQIRRAATSIGANIAEGHGRENTGSFIQFLRMSQDLLKELETYPTIAKRVKVADEGSVSPLLQHCDEPGRMLRALTTSEGQELVTIPPPARRGPPPVRYSLFAIRYSLFALRNAR